MSKVGVDLRTKSLSVSAPINKTDVTDLITLGLDLLVNADIAGGAAILQSKLDPIVNGDLPNLPVLGTLPASPRPLNIVNSEIDAGAAIVFSKLQNINSLRILGRQTTGSGVIEELTTDGTLQIISATTLRRSLIIGDISIPAGSNTAAIAAGVIVNADINASAAILQSKLAAIVLANLPIGTAFQRYRTNSGATAIENFTEEAALVFVIGDGSAVITTGIKLHIRVPFDCEINAATLLNKESGSIVVDVNRYTSLANFDAGTKASITSSTPPTTSSAKSSEDTTLTSWTVVLNKGDVLEAEVDSVTTVTRTTLELRVNKRG